MLAEKEVEVARLRRDIAGKQKIIVDIEKLGPNIVQPSIGANQKVKTVVVVDQKSEGVQMKTQVPPSNMINNKWIHNTRKALDLTFKCHKIIIVLYNLIKY